MKRVLTILSFLILVTVSCDESAEQILYTGPDFVFLDSKPQVSLYENKTSGISIPVKVNLAQTENVKVTFEVVGTNILAGVDYTVLTPSPIEIPRNKYSATIDIKPINNAIIQPEQRTIIVRITSVDKTNLMLQVVKEVEIDLLDDDCAPTVPKVSIWIADVNIGGAGPTASGTGEGGPGGICGGVLVVNGFFFGANNPSSRMTILMTQDPNFPTKGFTSVIRYPYLEGNTTYDYEASGTYDEISKSITLNFTLYYNPDGSFSTGTHIITPK